MQSLEQTLRNVIDALIVIAGAVLILALINAGLNMASADPGRQDKAKKQLVGIVIAIVIIFGAKIIVPQIISLVSQ
jgi:type IV secretory pathway VirB2 component (pilin)